MDPFAFIEQVATWYGGPGWRETAVLGARALLVAIVLLALFGTIGLAIRSKR